MSTEKRIAALNEKGTSFLRRAPIEEALRSLDAEAQIALGFKAAGAEKFAEFVERMLAACEAAIEVGDFVKAADAATALGKTQKTVRNWCLAGHIDYERRGRAYWVSFPSAERYARRAG